MLIKKTLQRMAVWMLNKTGCSFVKVFHPIYIYILRKYSDQGKKDKS